MEEKKPVTIRVLTDTRDEILSQRRKDPSKRGGIETADDVLKRRLRRTYVEFDLSPVRQELAGDIEEVELHGPDPYIMTVTLKDGKKVKIKGVA